MIIVRIQGGLGNQLQQYAMYCKFNSLGVETKVDLSWFREDIQKKQIMPRKLELLFFQGLVLEECTEKEKADLIGRENDLFAKLQRRLCPGKSRYFAENGRMYLPEVFTLRDAYVDGYWACESYYHDMLPLLQQKLVFPVCPQEEIAQKNRQIMEKMAQENSVSIHIRRGDYLDAANAALFGNICTEDYYDEAINTIGIKIQNPHFYIFSDDVDYARERYHTSSYTVIDWNQGDNSYFDIQLMSHCKHNICANSTFSFWGARLNRNTDKLMIRPLKHRNNQEYNRFEMEKLWPGYILL